MTARRRACSRAPVKLCSNEVEREYKRRVRSQRTAERKKMLAATLWTTGAAWRRQLRPRERIDNAASCENERVCARTDVRACGRTEEAP
eukprot:6180159-Pleurochrysis_carterae.AAC.1